MLEGLKRLGCDGRKQGVGKGGFGAGVTMTEIISIIGLLSWLLLSWEAMGGFGFRNRYVPVLGMVQVGISCR